MKTHKEKYRQTLMRVKTDLEYIYNKLQPEINEYRLNKKNKTILIDYKLILSERSILIDFGKFDYYVFEYKGAYFVTWHKKDVASEDAELPFNSQGDCLQFDNPDEVCRIIRILIRSVFKPKMRTCWMDMHDKLKPEILKSLGEI